MVDPDKDQKFLSRAEKTTSTSRSIFRIIFGICAFLLWVLLGIPPTLIYSSGIQTFIGTVSFFIRNPVIFLLIAILNVLAGLISYYFLQIWWYTLFHILWSVRWFYGYEKYRLIKK
jgi:uncharacterized membrane-anchored protein YitT (DUF2179 family)